MKKIKALTIICIALLSSIAYAQNSEQSQTSDLKKVAIFVRNDSGKTLLDDKAKSLEYAISSKLNNLGFGIVNHDLVLRNLNAYLDDPNAKHRTLAESIKRAKSEGTSLDAKLFEEASGAQISEMIGADYILNVSYSSLGTEKKTFDSYGIKTINTLYNLRSTYNLYEGGGSTGTAGGSVKASKTVRQTADLTVESDDVLDELIEETANQIGLLLSNQKTQIVAKENNESQIDIIFAIEAMSMPEIIKDENDTYILGSNLIPATIPFVTASIDGIAQTLGGKIHLSKGIHRLKINQKDIAPVEMIINVTGKEGQTMNIALSLSDEARLRWKEDMAFVEAMKDRAKESDNRRMLTEAEVERIKGIAQMYQQSGYKIDFKVDAKEFPEINKTQSVFSQ